MFTSVFIKIFAQYERNARGQCAYATIVTYSERSAVSHQDDVIKTSPRQNSNYNLFGWPFWATYFSLFSLYLHSHHFLQLYGVWFIQEFHVLVGFFVSSFASICVQMNRRHTYELNDVRFLKTYHKGTKKKKTLQITRKKQFPLNGLQSFCFPHWKCRLMRNCHLSSDDLIMRKIMKLLKQWSVNCFFDNDNNQLFTVW